MPNPIFRALTRPTLKARVTIGILAIETVITMLSVLWTGSLSSVFLIIPLHLINMSLLEYDHNIFKLMGNYLKHSLASTNKRFWKARSYRP